MTSSSSAPGRTDVVVRQAGELCEGPLWDARIGALVWVDIPLGVVHRLTSRRARMRRPRGGSSGRLSRAARVGWLSRRDRAWRRRGRRRLAELREIADLPGQAARTRTNDGACDPWGCFWVGTTAQDDRPGAAALYRLTADGTVHQVLDGVSVSNGIDWAPDASAMYYADSGTGRVDVFDVDPSDGHVTGRRSLLEIELPGAVPDGLTVDAEGFLWVALWDGGRVRRYTPDGRLDREVLLPVDRVTSVAFGGPSLDALYVTTARFDLSAAAFASQPLAGSIFVHDPGVPGRPPNAWAG